MAVPEGVSGSFATLYDEEPTSEEPVSDTVKSNVPEGVSGAFASLYSDELDSEPTSKKESSFKDNILGGVGMAPKGYSLAKPRIKDAIETTALVNPAIKSIFDTIDLFKKNDPADKIDNLSTRRKVYHITDQGLRGITQGIKTMADGLRMQIERQDPDKPAYIGMPLQQEERLLSTLDIYAKKKGKSLNDLSQKELDEIRLEHNKDRIESIKPVAEKLKSFGEAMPKRKKEKLSGRFGKVEEAVHGMAMFAPSMAATAISGPVGAAMTLNQIFGMKWADYEQMGLTKTPEQKEKAFYAAIITGIPEAGFEFAGN